MKTSAKGKAYLDHIEYVALKAYRDVVGVWTIGSGLTAASGVVVPKAGMTITKKEAMRLMSLALERNYEPTVRKAMPGASQHEFDGGVTFHWNTGAIMRASWLKRWLAGDMPGVRAGLARWNKGGGKVLAGLVRRRREEADMIILGIYHIPKSAVPSKPGKARIVVPLDAQDLVDLRKAFAKLGYKPGDDMASLDEAAVRAFQRDHDLTVDGIVGPATIATLQRMRHAREKAVAPATVTTAGGAGSAVPTASVEQPAVPPELAWLVLGVGLVWVLWLAWQYRDAIAVKVQGFAPSFAKLLRSY